MENFLRIYLPVYMVLYLLVAFGIPTYRTWKRTGINPVVFGKSNSAHDYIGRVMKLIILLLLADVIAFSAGEHFYPYLVPVLYLQSEVVLISGLFIIHISLVWITVAQYQMGISWRIGIDEKHTTPLVTKGIFSISRNPVFFGMILSVLGIFLILPNAVSLSLLLLTYFIIQAQIRLEEEFLEKQHGEKYRHYQTHTRRLI